MADEAGRRYGVSLQNTPWAAEVTKNRSFMVFNTVELVKELGAAPRISRILGGETVMIMNNLFGPCEYVDVMAPDWKPFLLFLQEGILLFPMCGISHCN